MSACKGGFMSDSTVNELINLEYQVEDAVVRKDIPLLSTLCGEDFRFTHGTGRVDSKASWIESLQSNPSFFRSRTLSELGVEMHGELALTSGRISVVSGTGRSYSIRYLRTYAHRDGRWQMVSHHTILMKPAPLPPPISFQLASAIAPTEPVLLASGFDFTEGPLWHPAGAWYFVDVRSDPSRQFRLTPEGIPELFRSDTGQANGTTLDLDGNLVVCESGNRRVTRLHADGHVEVVADQFEGKKLNRPNDVICAADGSIYFTDPGLRLPIAERELPSAVYRVASDGALSQVAECEYPNGLAFSPDESTLYVANTRHAMYIMAFDLDTNGRVTRRGVFADMSSEDANGVPDGMKVDVEGRVYCTGAGSGIWVFAPDGAKLGIIPIPEVPANLAFGGSDFRTILVTARTSVYALHVSVPGLPGHPYRLS